MSKIEPSQLVDVRLNFTERGRDLDILSPAELPLTKEEKLFLNVIKRESFCKNKIEIFDNWTENILPKQIEKRELRGRDGTLYRLKFDRYEKPTTGEGKSLLPITCRNNKHTYKIGTLSFNRKRSSKFSIKNRG